MKEQEVRDRAFAVPLTQPAYPRGPYRFVDREYFIITYRTDPEKLRTLVPEPLQIEAPLVRYEFIRMPDSTGFGDYTESGQVIPVSFRGRKGSPTLRAETDTLIGTLDYGPVRVATGTMGYKHHAMDIVRATGALSAPNFLLKIIPHVDGSPRICELVEYHMEDIQVKGAWTGPAALSLTPHALAPVAELPVLEVVAATHSVADVTLGLGTVVHDYLR
jgi:acetoacetate decarboxylase